MAPDRSPSSERFPFPVSSCGLVVLTLTCACSVPLPPVAWVTDPSLDPRQLPSPLWA